MCQCVNVSLCLCVSVYLSLCLSVSLSLCLSVSLIRARRKRTPVTTCLGCFVSLCGTVRIWTFRVGLSLTGQCVCMYDPMFPRQHDAVATPKNHDAAYDPKSLHLILGVWFTRCVPFGQVWDTRWGAAARGSPSLRERALSSGLHVLAPGKMV
jgi:hypothetical protein